MTARYAIYYAPEADSALWRFGRSILGYDAISGADVEAWRPDGYTAEAWHLATADPRRYGFHATLKAPFHLADGREEAGLVTALEQAGSILLPVTLGQCPVGVVPSAQGGGFVAMTPDSPPPGLSALERAIVVGFEPWRAPLTSHDRERRAPHKLTARQAHNLDCYGYPYALEEFQFHMTLTGRLDEPAPVAEALQRRASGAGAIEDVELDRLALFRQDSPQARFLAIAAFPLRGSGVMLPPQFGE